MSPKLMIEIHFLSFQVADFLKPPQNLIVNLRLFVLKSARRRRFLILSPTSATAYIFHRHEVFAISENLRFFLWCKLSRDLRNQLGFTQNEIFSSSDADLYVADADSRRLRTGNYLTSYSPPTDGKKLFIKRISWMSYSYIYMGFELVYFFIHIRLPLSFTRR